MEKIPVHNNTAMPIYVGGAMIPPGETRHFNADQVPPEYRPAKVEEAQADEPGKEIAPEEGVKLILAGTVDTVKATLADLSDATLALLKDAEEAGKNRSSLLEAVDAELLKRQAGGE